MTTHHPKQMGEEGWEKIFDDKSKIPSSSGGFAVLVYNSQSFEFLGDKKNIKSFIRQLLASEKEKLLKEIGDKRFCCPPHEMVDFHYEGMWGASTPPPNKKCLKCLMETRF